MRELFYWLRNICEIILIVIIFKFMIYDIGQTCENEIDHLLSQVASKAQYIINLIINIITYIIKKIYNN